MQEDFRAKYRTRHKANHSRSVYGRNSKKKPPENGGPVYKSLVLQSIASAVVLTIVISAISFKLPFSETVKGTLRDNLQEPADLEAVNTMLEEAVSNNKLLSNLFDPEQGIAVFWTKEDGKKEDDEKQQEDQNGEEDGVKISRVDATFGGGDRAVLLDMAAARAGEQQRAVPAMGGQELEPVDDSLPANPDNVTPGRPELGVEIAMPLEGTVTSVFGYREHPINGVVSFHYGTDLGAAMGTEIHVVASGTVEEAGSNNVYGNYLLVDHGGGVESFYGHCSKLLKSEGDQVTVGDVIAKVGSTGLSTGAHLHLGLKLDGKYLDPQLYLDD